MNKPTLTEPHWSFWVIAVLALIWNLMGCANYLMHMNAEYVASLPESYQSGIGDHPVWATSAFAIVEFEAAIGCILLLIRKSYVLYILALSLIGMGGVLIYAVVGVFVLGTGGPLSLGGTTIYFVVAIVLVWYTDLAIKKNWIG